MPVSLIYRRQKNPFRWFFLRFGNRKMSDVPNLDYMVDVKEFQYSNYCLSPAPAVRCEAARCLGANEDFELRLYYAESWLVCILIHLSSDVKFQNQINRWRNLWRDGRPRRRRRHPQRSSRFKTSSQQHTKWQEEHIEEKCRPGWQQHNPRQGNLQSTLHKMRRTENT